MKLLKVYPAKSVDGEVTIPSSKPETQRAILIGSLAKGTSKVFNDLHCVETNTMKNACRSIGAKITEHDNFLEVEGYQSTGLTAKDIPVVNCIGSGLVARTFLTLSSVLEFPVIVTGNQVLRNRIIGPLLSSLEGLGVHLDYLAEPEKLPILNRSTRLLGGRCMLPGNLSSQFITALLLAAPLAESPVEIEIEGQVYSKSYIRQTVAAMEHASVKVEYSEGMNFFRVEPSEYQAVDTEVFGDYTGASYVLARAALFPGKTVLHNMSEHSLQGEQAIVDILRALDVSIEFDASRKTLTVNNNRSELKGDIEFDVTDCPNIIPTLAALGAFVQGRFRVTGGALTNYHKCSRIQAMITELRKMGVDIEPVYQGDLYDGFEVRGQAEYQGGVTLESWGDHRIFMSLLFASMKVREPNLLEGFESVDCSFPDFLAEFNKIGAKYQVVEQQTNKAEIAA
jgi:3-phosphoshikimate 1-carboxyvinyltransferase